MHISLSDQIWSSSKDAVCNVISQSVPLHNEAMKVSFSENPVSISYIRKCSEQRNLEFEDHHEAERKELNLKVESLSSIVKMFELKSKNSQDQITRLEDKETEMKKEYSKLHERYTELFKSHMDYMERSKAMMGSERMEQMQNMGAARNRIGGMSLNQLNR